MSASRTAVARRPNAAPEVGLGGTAYILVNGFLHARLELRADAAPLLRAGIFDQELRDALAGLPAAAYVRLPCTRPRGNAFTEGLALGAVLGVLTARCSSLTLLVRNRPAPDELPTPSEATAPDAALSALAVLRLVWTRQSEETR